MFSICLLQCFVCEVFSSAFSSLAATCAAWKSFVNFISFLHYMLKQTLNCYFTYCWIHGRLYLIHKLFYFCSIPGQHQRWSIYRASGKRVFSRYSDRKTAINILYTRAAYLPTAGCLQSLCVACKPSLPALAHSLTPLWYPNLATSIGGE